MMLEMPHTLLHQSAEQIIQLKEAGDHEAARKVFENVSMPNVQKVLNAMKAVSGLLDEEQISSSNSFEESVNSSRQAAYGCIGLGLVIAGLLGLLLARTVTAPTVALARYAERLAEGDLDATIAISREDELGTLAASLQRMVINIKHMIRTSEEKTREAEASSAEALEAMRTAEEARKAAQEARREGMLSAAGELEQVVSVISAASEELSVRVEQSERGSHNQASRVSGTAAAME